MIEVRGMKALHQKWIWEGIIGESLIFLDNDVNEKSDEDLIAVAHESGLMQEDNKATIARNSSGYTFVNMNFENPM